MRGTVGILVAAAVVMVVVLFIFDSHLLSERCDHQVHVLTAEKQRASRHIKELQQALAKSSETLEKLRVGKVDPSARSLHSQLSALTADAGGGGGVKPRRRARQPPPPSPNPPPPSLARAAEQISAAAPVQAAAASSLLTPGRIAVVVIAYNRPRLGLGLGLGLGFGLGLGWLHGEHLRHRLLAAKVQGAPSTRPHSTSHSSPARAARV